MRTPNFRDLQSQYLMRHFSVSDTVLPIFFASYRYNTRTHPHELVRQWKCPLSTGGNPSTCIVSWATGFRHTSYLWYYTRQASRRLARGNAAATARILRTEQRHMGDVRLDLTSWNTIMKALHKWISGRKMKSVVSQRPLTWRSATCGGGDTDWRKFHWLFTFHAIVV